jgi:hypothetical protein
MADLASLGITAQRNFHTEATQVNGITTSEKEYTELAFALPTQAYPDLQLTLTREGFGKKLVKIFKKELQTGDAPFDALIYISTETPDQAKALLGNEAFRRDAALLVEAGGHLEVDGGFVKLVVAGRQETDDDHTLALARALCTK